MVILIILNEVKKLIIKHTWKKLFPTYTKDEYKRKRDEQARLMQKHVNKGECWKAVDARRRVAQYQLKIMRITYNENLRLIREECKRAKKI